MALEKVGLTVTVGLYGRVKRDGAVFVSSCPQLDVFSQGSTEREAMESLKEAVAGFLISCFENGTLEEVLKDSGFKIDKKAAGDKAEPKAPRGTIPMQIPIPLLKERAAAALK